MKFDEPKDTSRGQHSLARSCLLAAAAALAAVALAAAQNTTGAGKPYLYLLNGIPSGQGDYHASSATLLAVNGEGRLVTVRQIVPASVTGQPDGGGLDSVIDDESGTVYVTSPPFAGSRPDFNISVIHEEAPGRSDTFSFSAAAYGANPYGFSGLVAADGQQPCLLIFTNVRSQNATLRLLGAAGGASTRIQPGGWDDYKLLRVRGLSAGPWLTDGFGTTIAADGFDYPAFLDVALDNRVTLAPLPQSLPQSIPRGQAYPGATVLGANARFLVFEVPTMPVDGTYLEGDPSFWQTAPTYIYDRAKRTWQTMTLPTPRDQPTARIFGDWLAVPVAIPGPGPSLRDGENWETARAYVNHEGGDMVHMAGQLLLLNLADGRRLTIETGHEDSEVLDISAGGIITYRVNDCVYEAAVDGDHVGPAKLLVQDKNVVEAHWGFWSAAPPTAVEGNRR